MSSLVFIFGCLFSDPKLTFTPQIDQQIFIFFSQTQQISVYSWFDQRVIGGISVWDLFVTVVLVAHAVYFLPIVYLRVIAINATGLSCNRETLCVFFSWLKLMILKFVIILYLFEQTDQFIMFNLCKGLRFLIKWKSYVFVIKDENKNLNKINGIVT